MDELDLSECAANSRSNEEITGEKHDRGSSLWGRVKRKSRSSEEVVRGLNTFNEGKKERGRMLVIGLT